MLRARKVEVTLGSDASSVSRAVAQTRIASSMFLLFDSI